MKAHIEVEANMKTQNEGIRTYQESKRQEKLSKIDEAYQYLKESHLSITKKALSDASGIPLRTIHQPYAQQHLLQYPEFNPDSVPCDSTGTITALEDEVKRLKCLLSKSRNDNNQLKAENLSLKEECRKLNYEYACVLGDNQKLRENKLIRL